MNRDVIIGLQNLVVGYHRKRQAVSVMSFPEIHVEKGDFIAIAGPNGIGKSTFIKTLMQLIPKISGNVLLYGKPASSYSRTHLASMISYVSTEVIHNQQMTIRDLVTFGRYPYTNWFGKIEKEDLTIVDNAISMLELEHLAARNIDEVSDGERQKAMIARALAQQTDIVILDEPTAFLDLPHKYEIVNLLGKLSREFHKTIIFTTHDLGIAIREVDKLWILSNEGFFHGTPEDLILNGTISRTFNTPKVAFDNRKGEFTIKKTYKPLFHITGKASVVHWTRNAIEKDGFTVADKESEGGPTISIEQTPSGYQWTCTWKTKTNVLKSISELRSFVRDNFAPEY
jgi:iron complex transport system ATP-binding protein